MYYNTTKEKEIKEFEKKTRTQDDNILRLLEFSELALGASDLYNLFYNTPITSIRRSLNTLMKKGLVNRVDKKIGMYGRKEYTYEANV